MKKRASIFAFYDENGIVDDYVVFLLQEMKKCCEYQCVVVNGTLTKESEQKLQGVTDEILYRENKGFDITGYRYGFLQKYEKLCEYDEVVFYNQTVFGPFYPFTEMFDKMDTDTIDFWGMTSHSGTKACPEWASHVGYIPFHIQSYFLVIKKTLFNDTRFHDYWQNLCEIKGYFDAVGKFEIVFTKYFTDMGYKGAPYIDTTAYNGISDYPLMARPIDIIENYRCPVAKRKSFMFNRNDLASVYYGCATQELYRFIKDNTSYNFDMIKQNLTRTIDIRTLTYSLTPCFMSKMQTELTKAAQKQTIIILNVSSKMELDYILQKADELSKEAELIVLSQEQEIISKFSNFEGYCCKDSYSFMFSELWPKIAQYEYCAYLTNDVKEIYGEVYDLSALINAFDTVGNIKHNQSLLKQNDDFGVLIQYPSYKGRKFSTAVRWDTIADKCRQMCSEMGLNLHLDKKSPPLICESGMFFAKTSAINDIKSVNIEKYYDIFTKSRLKLYNCIVPLAAFSKGFFTGFLFKEQYLFSDLLNTESMLDDLKGICTDYETDRYDLMRASLQGKLDHYNKHHNDMTLRQAFEAKLGLKQKLYIIYHLFKGIKDN